MSEKDMPQLFEDLINALNAHTKEMRELIEETRQNTLAQKDATRVMDNLYQDFMAAAGRKGKEDLTSKVIDGIISVATRGRP